MNEFNLFSLIAPVSTDDFFRNYWETKFIHIPHPAGYFDDILSIEALDEYLSRQDLTPEAIKLVKNGTRIPELQYTSSSNLADGSAAVTVDNGQLFKHYNAGATIIINSAQRAIPSLFKACRLFEQSFNMAVQANVYITPPRSQGFSVHYDPHDIFLLQVKGPKTWQIYDSGEELPSVYRAFSKEPELVAKFDIQSGDFLYLPRGTAHEAFSSEVSTIHVNISCKARYGYHLIQDIAALAEETDVFFRQTIPHGYKTEEEITDYLHTFSKKLNELISQTSMQTLLSRQEHKFAQGQQLDFKGLLSNSLLLEGLTPDTFVAKRSGFKYLTENTANGCEVKFGKHVLLIPAFITPAIFLQNEPFRISDIKGLVTNQGKLTLVRDLIKAGFLEVVTK